MKIKINFTLSGKKQQLPLNYQYPVSSWIYKVLNSADEDFGAMLHELGYKLENGKTFKLFTFSQMGFPQHTWKIAPKSDRMQIWARKAWLTVSFHLPEQTEKFVMGLFQQQSAFIGDKISGVEMQVESIEALKDVEIEEGANVKIKAKTAIVLGIIEDGKVHEQYVSPLHPEYKDLFLRNLLDKYRATGKEDHKIEDMDFELQKLYTKTAMQTIKAGTPAQTKVRGYYFDFELTAPKEIIQVGLNAGFGSMNSLGFGFGEVVEEKDEA